MSLDRLRFVARVLGELGAAEVGRTVRRHWRFGGGRGRPGASDGGGPGNRRSGSRTGDDHGDDHGDDLVGLDEHRRERAREVRRSLERLGPFYIKVGQILSTRPDILPPWMIAELKTLHDRVSVAPFADFEPVLAEELGVDWKRCFTDIDTTAPLGTASLAQVYRVTLPGGQPAVVKVQRPGVRDVVLQDMAILRRAARLVARSAPRFSAVVDVEAMLRVVFEAMEPEYDFVVEARNMARGRETVARFSHLSVPEVWLATKRVLVMERAPGRSIGDVDRAAFTPGERPAIGRDLLAHLYRGFFVDHYFHADPHPGNVFVHPGEGASLIDWGMVGRVDRNTALQMILILLTLGQNDGRGLARAWIEMGRATPGADIAGFTSDMAALVPRFSTASLEDLDFGVALTAVLERSTKRGIQTSPVVAILGKAFGNIEGSIRCLAPELSLVEVFQQELGGILLDVVRRAVSGQQAARTALELLIGSSAANDQLRGLLRDLSNRELTLRLHHNEVQRPFTHRPGSPVLLGLGAAALYLHHRRRR